MNANEARDALSWPRKGWTSPDTIPTGSLGLDLLLGGGWPRGRLSELYGEEGSGKSTLAYAGLELSAEREELSMLITPVQSVLTGRQEVVAGASTDAEAVQIIRESAPLARLIVLDSLDSLDIEHPDHGWNRQMLANVSYDLAANTSAAVFLAGLRDYSGRDVYAMNHILRGLAHVRVRLDVSMHREYSEVTATVVKNVTRPPEENAKARFRIQDGKIDRAREVAELAVSRGLIEKRGSWFYCGKSKLAQGMDNLVTGMTGELQEVIERNLWA